MAEFDGGFSFPSLSKSPLDRIWDFISDCSLSFSLRYSLNVNQAEEDISDLLAEEFIEKRRQSDMFMIIPKQREQPGSKFEPDFTVKLCSDISFVLKGKHYVGRDPIMKIEAKRLDSSLPRSRENEYVIGNGLTKGKSLGGIERYKNESHGANVLHFAMIGYLQSNDLKFWQTKINTIIQNQIKSSSDPDLEWADEDLLVRFGKIAEISPAIKMIRIYSSTHSRKTKPPIACRHFWVDLRK